MNEFVCGEWVMLRWKSSGAAELQRSDGCVALTILPPGRRGEIKQLRSVTDKTPGYDEALVDFHESGVVGRWMNLLYLRRIDVVERLGLLA